MRRYETVFVINADLSDEEIQNIIDNYIGIIQEKKGVPINVERWGRKKLAYEIRKHLRGYYVLLDYAGQPIVPKELERNFKIDERILRFITVRTEDRFDSNSIQKDLSSNISEKTEPIGVKEEATIARVQQKTSPPLEG
ncbi:MAG: 30S ribosomal protein S6 [Syntrophales bacterium]|nr:30S ribosomal protein S6 [Syntrophales bacterium]